MNTKTLIAGLISALLTLVACGGSEPEAPAAEPMAKPAAEMAAEPAAAAPADQEMEAEDQPAE